jgi:DNA repair exonuclease SbcCD ATPase subunit
MTPPEQDLERGFGTGLRAQLEKRQGADEAPEPQQPSRPTVPEPAAESVLQPVVDEARALRAELEAAHNREHELRTELAELQANVNQELNGAQALSLRSTEVDQRAARLAAQQQELEERERELQQRAEAAAAEQQRLAELKSELAAQEARTSEREKQISSKLRELTNADRERTTASVDPPSRKRRSRSGSARSSGRWRSSRRANPRPPPAFRRGKRSSKPARGFCATRRPSTPIATARSRSATGS